MTEHAWWEFFTLRDGSVRDVLFGCMLLGAGAGALGCFAVLRRRALVGDAVAHAVLPGVCLAFLLTGTKDPWWLLMGAMATGWLSMVSMDLIVRRTKLTEDAAIGIVLSVFFGAGILLLTYIQGAGSGNQAGLDSFLFGQAASLVHRDVLIFGGLSVGVVATLFILFNPFKLLAFDPGFAQAVGLPTKGLEFTLTTLMVLAVTIGIQAVGVVLMAAVLITPAAAARYWTDGLARMVALAALFGALSGAAGAFVSYTAPSMPTGPWMVVAVTAIFVFSLLFAPRRGVAARWRRQAVNRRRAARENLLKTLYLLGETDHHLDAPRSARDVQRRRAVDPASVRKLAGELGRAGLVHTERGADGEIQLALTPTGVEAGRRIVRLHRLWEIYLTDYVHIAPDHVHEDADSIEHVLTPELEARLTELLNRPALDPHAAPVPYD